MADPGKRELGLMIQPIRTAFLLFGSLGKIIYAIAPDWDFNPACAALKSQSVLVMAGGIA